MIRLRLGEAPLTLEQVARIARAAPREARVELAPAARARVEASRAYLASEIAAGKTIYGVNTGFGLLSNVRVKDADLAELQVNLLRSHCVGTGPALPDDSVRAMLLLRAAALAHGRSGVRPLLIEAILGLLNAGVVPVIPEQGSVGASGDLAPLAHLALVLIGEGRARFRGEEMSGRSALRKAGLKALKLGPKEGLALINGTQFMAALGTLALIDAEHLADLADAAGALTLEALRGTVLAFEPEIHDARPHPGQVLVARRVRDLLRERGRPSEIGRSHAGCGKVQDPYSLRCMPQVHGATRDALAWVRGVLEREVNAVTDNPLVFVPGSGREGRVLSGGNFHGQVVAMAMDFLAIAVAELASISEQRIEKLVNPATSDLPPFLTKRSGLNSGFMIVQVAAAALVSENKTLCHPAVVDSIPTSADKEDHVSMGAWAARKAHRVLENARRVLAMELLAAAQGIDLLRPLRSTDRLEKLHRRVRRAAKRLDRDREFAPEIAAVERQIVAGEYAPLVQLEGSARKGPRP